MTLIYILHNTRTIAMLGGYQQGDVMEKKNVVEWPRDIEDINQARMFCDEMFRRYNDDSRADFQTVRSLSVGDVVVTACKDRVWAFACAVVGWSNIPVMKEWISQTDQK